MAETWPTWALTLAGVITVLFGLLSPYAIVEGHPLNAFEAGYAEGRVILTAILLACVALAGFRTARRVTLAACIATTALAAYLAVAGYRNVPEAMAGSRGLDASAGPAILIVLVGQLALSAAVFTHTPSEEASS